MACGLPVVAARATALPETVGGAGLTFTPDDPADLARQLRRVLGVDAPNPSFSGLPPSAHPPRVAVVSIRYGTDFAGGAEASLRRAAEALHGAGCRVEVFTTRTRSAVTWSNNLPEGTTLLNGIPVHRFTVDAYDLARHHASVRTILQSDGRVNPDVEREYLRHSLNSSVLVAELRRRAAEFDAVLVGPYLFGLTFAVAEALPDQTILVPCFHDEPMARLSAWRPVYERVGGVLFHSAAEQHFAETELGLNHPGGAHLGTWLDLDTGDSPQADSDITGLGRYIIYCGRYSEQKDFPLLLDHARRYHAAHPDRFTFVFVGQGEVPVPREPWSRDLGFVPEARKQALLAHAAALVQPSRQESLSLAALEAWGQGTPVVGRHTCAAVADHLRRCGAGRAVEGFDEFAAALDDLWQRPEHWRELGRRGRDYVRAEYGSRAAYTARLLEAIADLRRPLAERMRRRGLERAAALDRPAWRDQFARLIEDLLDQPPVPRQTDVEVRPRSQVRRVRLGTATALVAVRAHNRGTLPLLPDGPARTRLACRVLPVDGTAAPANSLTTPLPALVIPGRSLAAVVAVPVPSRAGAYSVVFWAERADQASSDDTPLSPNGGGALRLVVRRGRAADGGCCPPLTEAAQAALAEAARLQRLPDDYVDVTEGFLAAWKRRVKRKLLGNFKHAYVDVLSRQQSTFNQQLVAAVQQLAEACATLDHAVQLLCDRVARLERQAAPAPDAQEAPLSAPEKH
jgi:glycosyltransferase involved in cell wall biosynthesis